MIEKIGRSLIVVIFIISVFSTALLWAAAKQTELSHFKSVATRLFAADGKINSYVAEQYRSSRRLSANDRKLTIPIGPMAADIDLSEISTMSEADFDRLIIDEIVNQIYFGKADASLSQVRQAAKQGPLDLIKTILSAPVHHQLLRYRSFGMVLAIIITFVMMAVYRKVPLVLLSIGFGLAISAVLGLALKTMLAALLWQRASLLPAASTDLIKQEVGFFFVTYNYLAVVGLTAVAIGLVAVFFTRTRQA